MKIEILFVAALWIGYIIGVLIENYVSERNFSKYTLNCVEQNMSLKEMAFERFPNDYKLRFNDWHNLGTSTPSTLKAENDK
jgi:hypothetical protein